MTKKKIYSLDKNYSADIFFKRPDKYKEIEIESSKFDNIITMGSCNSYTPASFKKNALSIQLTKFNRIIEFDKNQKLIILIPIAILIVAIIKGVASYFQSILMSFIGYKLVADIQNQMFNAAIRCDLSYYNQINSGTLVSRFIADVGALSRGVHNVIINIVKDSFTNINFLPYKNIDVLMGGVPCQSFSQAGKRKGLEDDRGNLLVEFINLI